jgi:hypothetical protein
MLIPVEGTGKNQLEPSQESMGRTPVLPRWSLQRILDQNGQVCWSIVVKARPTVGSPFYGIFLLTASLRRRRMSVHISLFTAAIPVNYTREFRELFKAT